MAPPGADVTGLETHARCTLTEAHSGAHRRAHGGVVALILDQATGRVAHFAGAGGLTARLEVNFRRGTPLGVPLEITARWIGRDGRKSYAEAEIYAEGVLAATGNALMVIDPTPEAAE
jgi:acyl-coenzyme A thioesterase PaaI-like protein